MIGTVIINFIIAIIGFIFAFLFSFLNNGLLTSLIRGFYTFVIFFLITYLFRALIFFVLIDKKKIILEDNHNVQQNEISTEIPLDQTNDINKASAYIQDLLNTDGKNN